jgi:hypothetical protein
VVHSPAFKLVSCDCRRQHSMVNESTGSSILPCHLLTLTLDKLITSPVPQLPFCKVGHNALPCMMIVSCIG